jgi:hypothetical protein
MILMSIGLTIYGAIAAAFTAVAEGPRYARWYHRAAK